jgi:hypothetical protein
MSRNYGTDLRNAERLFQGGTQQSYLSVPSMPSMPTIPDGGISTMFPPATEPVKRVLFIVGGILLILTTLAVLIFTVNAFFPFIDISPISNAFGLSVQQQLYWSNTLIPAGTDAPSALYISPADSITIRPSQFTFMFDIFIQSSKAPALGSYRHILHKGSDEYNQLAGTAITQGVTGDTSSDKTFDAAIAGSERMQGIPLPAQMSPGIFLHPYRNDLVFFIQTEAAPADVVGNDILYLESLAIEDVPLKEWFRITVMINSNVVDIFKDGDLLKSIVLKGKLRPVPNQWFGRSGPAPFSGVLQNLKLYNGILSPAQIKSAASSGFSAKPQIKDAEIC